MGGDLVIVQTGDHLDRGDEDRAILDLFSRLEVEAAHAVARVELGNERLKRTAAKLERKLH